jgi:CheY-like chemotaxis protein
LQGGESIRVLFVDDDKELSKSANECLNLIGEYKINLVTSADEASKKLAKGEYDAIVCDINMPLISGLDFLKLLRDSGNTIPFIVFTVTEDKETVLRAFSLGANGFVGKYGDPKVVFSTLKKCIDEAVTAKRQQNKHPEVINHVDDHK